MEQERAPLSPPGFWIGWPELVVLICWMVWGVALVDVGPKDHNAVLTASAILPTTLAGVSYIFFSIRHRARAGVPGDGPFQRIRDLVVFTYCGFYGLLFAPLVLYYVLLFNNGETVCHTYELCDSTGCTRTKTGACEN